MGMPACDCIPPDGDDMDRQWLRECEHHKSLRIDAERYRWLRDAAHDWQDAKIVTMYPRFEYERLSEGDLDARIDSEMAPRTYAL